MSDTQTLTKEQTEEVQALFNLGAHLGHKKNRLHPKAKKYLYKIVNGVSIIDLPTTVVSLEKARNAMKEAGKEGKTVLFVATKKIANQFTAELCEKNGIPYITMKWMPGLLTNFDTIMKNVHNLKSLRAARESGEWEKYVKHERIQLDKKIARLDRFYGGLVNLDKKPDILYVIDIRKEKNAVKEAKQNNLKVVAIVDTNSNPDEVHLPIVVNDDAAGVVEYVVTEIVKAYKS
ncbi:30S ribosomal protein S2 [Candidatus Roizmanbacteria bacterium]|nr:30S ribosomal protein S2 [Candidatus Roizmanbacteria bacterium]